MLLLPRKSPLEGQQPLGCGVSWGFCPRQVHAFYFDLHGMRLPKLLRQRLHGLGAARDQHEIRLSIRDEFRELDSKST
jgi:hypothetical protein